MQLLGHWVGERLASSMKWICCRKRCKMRCAQYLDKKSMNTAFIFTANDIKKVIPAIQSRALLVCFDVAPADCTEMKQRLQTRYMRILSEANIPYEPVRLERIIEDHFPDLRSVANHLQWEFGTAVAA